MIRLVWNADWVAPTNPIYDRSTLVGAAFRAAMERAAGTIPESALPAEELEAFKNQVRRLG